MGVVLAHAPTRGILLAVAPLTILIGGLGESAIWENWLRPSSALAVVLIVALSLFVIVLVWSGRLLKLRTTQRDQATEALAESEARLRLAQSAANIATIDWDFVTDRAIWSSNFEQVFGLPRDALAGPSSYEAILAFVHPDDKPNVDAMLLRLLKSGGAFSEEFRIVKPDGAVSWIATRGEVICDQKGRPRRLIGSNFDITERRVGEERLKRSLSDYRSRHRSRRNRRLDKRPRRTHERLRRARSRDLGLAGSGRQRRF